MENEVYQAPKSELLDENNDSQLEHEFYVVGIRKFCILFILTLSLYLVYWFYKNWKLYKEKNGEEIWPIARTIFAIFFTHLLFEYVDNSIRAKKIEYKWSPGVLATVYVLVAIISGLASNSSGLIPSMATYAPFITVISLFITGYVLLSAQKAINFSQNDRNGESNNSFTLANYLWCLFGLIYWALFIVGSIAIYQA